MGKPSFYLHTAIASESGSAAKAAAADIRGRSRAVVRGLVGAALAAAAVLAGASDVSSAARGSLFARLADADGRIPFPFEALLARMRERAEPADPLRVAYALIPFGRSLQRAAAAPAYLAHPRIVLAAVGGSSGDEPLADRLYLAYQERANSLELISWSPSAGRFEFELVDDYRAEGARRLVAAPRPLCAECHGDGPVFPAQPWSETQASEPLASRMAAVGPTYHGLGVGHDPGQVDDFAASVNRANLIPVWQAIFRRGCGALDASRAAACRTLSCEYALRSARRSGRAPAVDDSYVSLIAAALSAAWPDGLPVPDASIPDRDPLRLGAGAPAPMRIAAAAAVAPESEPSRFRPPRDRLRAEAASGVAARLAIGLGRAIRASRPAGVGDVSTSEASLPSEREACARNYGSADRPFDGAAVMHRAISRAGTASAPNSP